jgi:acetoin utilization protein AcuB
MSMPSVSQYMTPQPFSIERTATLQEAHALMRKQLVRHLPVLESGKLVGVVSQRDLHLLETIGEVDLEEVRVEEAMTAHPFIVTGDMPLDEVLDIMAEHKYGSVIVMGRGGVEGIFTSVDACKAFAEQLRRDAGMPAGAGLKTSARGR